MPDPQGHSGRQYRHVGWVFGPLFADPLFKAADDFISENNLGSPTSDEIQEVTSSLKRNGVTELDDLKRMTLDGVNYLVDKADLAEPTKGFLRTLSVRKKNPVNLDESVRLLGAGFNIFNEKTVSSQMFRYETRDTNFGVVIPGPARFSVDNHTKTFMETFETSEAMMQSRMKHLNVSLGVSTAAFLGPISASARAGFSAASSSSSTEASEAKECSFLLEQRMFEVSLGNFDEVNFTKEFMHDVENLPAHLDILNKDNRQAFEMFFDQWGQFVVAKAYGGGCVEVKINASSSSTDEAKNFDLKSELKAAINGAVAAGSTSKEIGYSTAANSTAHKMFSQSEMAWVGGDKAFHKSATLTDPKQMDKWRLSLIENPTMLTTDMDLIPISVVVGAHQPDKKTTCFNALKQFLGGKFHLQQKREDEEEVERLAELEEKIKMEKERKKMEMQKAQEQLVQLKRELGELTTRKSVAKAATPSVSGGWCTLL